MLKPGSILIIGRLLGSSTEVVHTLPSVLRRQGWLSDENTSAQFISIPKRCGTNIFKPGHSFFQFQLVRTPQYQSVPSFLTSNISKPCWTTLLQLVSLPKRTRSPALVIFHSPPADRSTRAGFSETHKVPLVLMPTLSFR